MTWEEFGRRLWARLKRDDVVGRAAQLSFFFVLALFPFLLFLTSLLGYFAGAGTELRADLLRYLSAVVPAKAYTLIYDTLDEITEERGGGKISLGLLAALWAATAGMSAIISALNAAYGVTEARVWWRKRLVSLALTVSLAVFINAALLLLLYGGQTGQFVAGRLGFGEAFTSAWQVLQWPFVLAFVLLAFTSIYYFAPNVRDALWRWLTPGSLLAVALWLLISFAFRTYLYFFDTYGRAYGSLGAVIVLLLWLYLTGAVLLLGGEVNALLENAAAEAGERDAKLRGQKEPGGEVDGRTNVRHGGEDV